MLKRIAEKVVNGMMKYGTIPREEKELYGRFFVAQGFKTSGQKCVMNGKFTTHHRNMTTYHTFGFLSIKCAMIGKG